MPTREEKQRMAEYLGDKLSNSSHTVKDHELYLPTSGESVIYLGLDNEDKLFLIDDSRKFTKRTTTELMRSIRSIENTTFVFYKDGETFFRCPESKKNSLEGLSNSLHPGRSLKNYTSYSPKDFIEPTPAERIIRENKKCLQYYQPKSERLEEMVVSFNSKIPTLDYSHIPENDRHGPVTKPSERYFLVSRGIKMPGNLDVEEGYLIRSREEPDEEIATQLELPFY
tara:strand:+ start:1104 stop:1781 length:678 start_codon:yes stop_codon:yes gene_type:complete